MGRGSSYDPEPILRHFPHNTCDEIAVALDVSRHTVNHWRYGRTGVRPGLADRIALQLGKHPANLWPEWPGQAEKSRR